MFCAQERAPLYPHRIHNLAALERNPGIFHTRQPGEPGGEIEESLGRENDVMVRVQAVKRRTVQVQCVI